MDQVLLLSTVFTQSLFIFKTILCNSYSHWSHFVDEKNWDFERELCILSLIHAWSHQDKTLFPPFNDMYMVVWKVKWIVQGARAWRLEFMGSYSRCVFLQSAPLSRPEGGFVSSCISLFSLPLLNLCPSCVYWATLPCGQRDQILSTGGCRTSVSRLSQNKLAETSGLTFSASSRQTLFSLLRAEWHFVSSRAQTFIITAVQFLILKPPAPIGWIGYRRLPCAIPSEVRSAQYLLEATPQNGLLCDSGFTLCSLSSFSQPGCCLIGGVECDGERIVNTPPLSIFIYRWGRIKIN